MKANLERQESKWGSCAFLPGALELLQWLQENKIALALATSSNKYNYERKTAHLQHGFSIFGEHIVTGDDPRVPQGRGKPFPDIWIAALKSLNSKIEGEPILPEECLVFEDAVPGLAAGRAAGAFVVWVPDQRALKVLNGTEEELVGGQGVILKSLEEFKPEEYFL